jgi:hypothetical protein
MADLLAAIDRVYREGELDEAAALEATKRALNREELGRGLEGMGYEDLLVVLSALRTLAAGAAEEEGDPF